MLAHESALVTQDKDKPDYVLPKKLLNDCILVCLLSYYCHAQQKNKLKFMLWITNLVSYWH